MNHTKIIVIVLSLFIVACTPVKLQTSEMTPVLNKSEYASTNKSLFIGKVIGKKDTGVHGGAIENEELKEALVETFLDSGIFKEVLSEGTGDYLLKANILSQKVEGVYSNTLPLLIRYELIDTASEKLLWSENIFSQKSISSEDEFVGVERIAKLRQMAIKDNLSQLVRKINEIISEKVE